MCGSQRRDRICDSIYALIYSSDTVHVIDESFKRLAGIGSDLE